MPHIHEKVDFTTSAFVIHADRVLLRKHDKYEKWLSVGGHVELDEDPNQALIREVKEETGLDVRLLGPHTPEFDTPREWDLVPPLFLNRHFVTESHEHVDLLYVARTESDHIAPGPDEKEVDMHWFTEEELQDPSWGIPERIRQYALKALEESRKWN